MQKSLSLPSDEDVLRAIVASDHDDRLAETGRGRIALKATHLGDLKNPSAYVTRMKLDCECPGVLTSVLTYRDGEPYETYTVH